MYLGYELLNLLYQVSLWDQDIRLNFRPLKKVLMSPYVEANRGDHINVDSPAVSLPIEDTIGSQRSFIELRVQGSINDTSERSFFSEYKG